MNVGVTFENGKDVLECQPEDTFLICHNKNATPCHFFRDGKCEVPSGFPSCTIQDYFITVVFIKTGEKK